MPRYPWYPELYRAHMRSGPSPAASPRVTWMLGAVAVFVITAYVALLCAILLA